jgi:hypothetical protein
VSGYVVLRLPLPGAVVTYFVTSSRTTSLQIDDRRSWRTLVRHDHSAMTGESGYVTRICERALPLPVKVRSPRWPPRPAPASWPSWRARSARRAVGSRARRVNGRRQACVGGQFIVEAHDEGADDAVMEAPDSGAVEADVMRGPRVPNASLRVDSTAPGRRAAAVSRSHAGAPAARHLLPGHRGTPGRPGRVPGT